MKKCIVAALALTALATSPAAVSDESTVILPLEAQACNLPPAPSRIPEDADLEALTKAKTAVTAFQAELVGYRDCLDKSRELAELTEGNITALNRAHDYSVDMEERIAEQFNIAVRAYKARQAESGQ